MNNKSNSMHYRKDDYPLFDLMCIPNERILTVNGKDFRLLLFGHLLSGFTSDSQPHRYRRILPSLLAEVEWVIIRNLKIKPKAPKPN